MISYARSASVETDETKETVMDADDSGRVDGNALAGPLSDVFVADVTTAGVTCTSCGRAQALAALEVYGAGPGMTARCAGCHEVVVRISRTPGRAFLDLRGTTVLRLSV